jgi:arylamine N-acetyltransferase
MHKYKPGTILSYANSLIKYSPKTKWSQLSKLKHYMHNHISTYMFSNRDYFDNNSKPKQFNVSTIINNLTTKKYGICMELNGAFNSFLHSQNYQSHLVKCYKQKQDSGEFYKVFHAGIIVNIDGLPYFVDVGFGEYFTEPILLKETSQNTGNINIKTICNEIYLTKGDKQIFKISGKASIKEINENYCDFFSGKHKDFPLCKYLFERIYDPTNNAFNEPKIQAKL